MLARIKNVGLSWKVQLAPAFLIVVLIGLGTAAVITLFGVSPILATLGAMTLLKGIGLVVTRGAAIGGLDGLQLAGNGSVAGIPVPLLLFGLAAAGVSVTLRRRPLGLKLAILGSSPRVAAIAGVDVARSIAKVYVASSLLAGLAALVMISRFNSAKVDYGEAYLLMTILAAVLGGTAAEGGFGWVSGLVLALAILQGVSSGFNLLGVSPFVTVAAFGLIILLVMCVRHAGAERGAHPPDRGGVGVVGQRFAVEGIHACVAGLQHPLPLRVDEAPGLAVGRHRCHGLFVEAVRLRKARRHHPLAPVVHIAPQRQVAVGVPGLGRGQPHRAKVAQLGKRGGAGELALQVDDAPGMRPRLDGSQAVA